MLQNFVFLFLIYFSLLYLVILSSVSDGLFSVDATDNLFSGQVVLAIPLALATSALLLLWTKEVIFARTV